MISAWKMPPARSDRIIEPQGREGPVEIIRPADQVFSEATNVTGAAPIRFMTHVAMQEVDDEEEGGPVGRARYR